MNECVTQQAVRSTEQQVHAHALHNTHKALSPQVHATSLVHISLCWSSCAVPRLVPFSRCREGCFGNGLLPGPADVRGGVHHGRRDRDRLAEDH